MMIYNMSINKMISFLFFQVLLIRKSILMIELKLILIKSLIILMGLLYLVCLLLNYTIRYNVNLL